MMGRKDTDQSPVHRNGSIPVDCYSKHVLTTSAASVSTVAVDETQYRRLP